jgi:nitrite reductase/ring-hydroxylating ferredoxin subunit
LCPADDLVAGGQAVRFELVRRGQVLPAFVVRTVDGVRAYVNRCAHIPIELDLMPGRVFDQAGTMLVCSTHGALYDACTGECRGGPCPGSGLEPVTVIEDAGAIYLPDEAGARHE